MKKFPYECTLKETGIKFIPIIIDYDTEEVWYPHSQVSDDGDWIGFDEVTFEKLDTFIDLAK